MTTKYQEYKIDSIRLNKILAAIETIQGQKFGCNTIDLDGRGNYRIRIIWVDGTIQTWTERYVNGNWEKQQ